MSATNEVADSAEWLPHQIDAASHRIQFLRIEPNALDAHGFLAVQRGLPEKWLSFDEVLSMRPAVGPISFIFHSGFCRSTLLLRALRVPGKTIGLNEPQILNSLAQLDNPDQRLVSAIVNLLSRQHIVDETVVIKPSNFPNRLVPLIMQARTDAKAIILTNTLGEFLEAIVRKGFEGRQWGRQTYLTAATYAGNVDVYEPLIRGMTDLQVAALGWLLMQSWFQKQCASANGLRIGVLHSDYFNAHRREALAATSVHLQLQLEQSDIQSVTDGLTFKSDAKTGVEYTAKLARDIDRSRSPPINEEIEYVCSWVDEVARASRLVVPIKQTLARSR